VAPTLPLFTDYSPNVDNFGCPNMAYRYDLPSGAHEYSICIPESASAI